MTTLEQLDVADDTLIARSHEGPFVALGEAVDHAPELRDALLLLSPDPRLDRYRRFRPFALAAPVSWAFLVAKQASDVTEFARNADRELAAESTRTQLSTDPATGEASNAYLHARLDRLVAMRRAYVGIEGTLAIAAALIVVIGSRRLRALVVAIGIGACSFWLFHAAASGRCFGVRSWRDLLLAALGLSGAIVAFALAPSETAVVRSLRTRLGLSTSTARGPLSTRRGFSQDVAAVIVASWAGLSLPFLLELMRRARLSDPFRASFFILFCFAVFLALLAYRVDDTRIAPRFQALALAALLGLGVTIGADIASRAALGVASEIAACVSTQSAKPFQALQTESGRETQSARRSAQSSGFAFLLAVLAAPLSEEMLYRGALQRIARRIMGARWAMLLSASIFALAHGFAFQHAFYQHFGLGLAFAAVFEMAGGTAIAVVACAMTHAAWNLWLASTPVF
ncbi:MAG: hypothetical protein NVSMB1_08990 [Polyangiales bacterium]